MPRYVVFHREDWCCVKNIALKVGTQGHKGPGNHVNHSRSKTITLNSLFNSVFLSTKCSSCYPDELLISSQMYSHKTFFHNNKITT